MQTNTDSPGIAPTNGASKAPSALTKLLAEVKGTKVNETDRKKVTSAFKAFIGKRAELQKALDDFDVKADSLAVDMVKCYGAKHLDVDGVRYVPTSRGERVYYKKMSDTLDVEKL